MLDAFVDERDVFFFLKIAHVPLVCCNRYVYTPIFMGWMNMKAAAHAKAFPEKLSLETVQNVKTFTQFNSHILSPVFDFSSPDVCFAAVVVVVVLWLHLVYVEQKTACNLGVRVRVRQS